MSLPPPEPVIPFVVLEHVVLLESKVKVLEEIVQRAVLSRVPAAEVKIKFLELAMQRAFGRDWLELLAQEKEPPNAAL